MRSGCQDLKEWLVNGSEGEVYLSDNGEVWLSDSVKILIILPCVAP